MTPRGRSDPGCGASRTPQWPAGGRAGLAGLAPLMPGFPGRSRLPRRPPLRAAGSASSVIVDLTYALRYESLKQSTGFEADVGVIDEVCIGELLVDSGFLCKIRIFDR